MKFSVLHLFPLAVFLVIGVIWDLRSRRIPNVVCAAIAVAGLGAQYWNTGGWAMLGGLATGAATIALLYVFWARGGIGGGDVKLAGAVAMWVAPRSLPAFWLAAALAGGAVSAVTWAASKSAARREIRANLTLAALQQAIPRVTPGTSGRVSVPYAVAIALGAFIVWWRGY